MLIYICAEMRIRDENKIQAIHQKAVEMIANQGLEGFGINRLAKEAGISPATIYIYYKDKDDLISSISVEEGTRMSEATLKGFDPEMSFEEGLWIQWKNRAGYMMKNPVHACFYERLRASDYKDKMVETVTIRFRDAMGQFMQNAIKRGEIDPMPLEVYWSIAFSPLYTLVRFHHEGLSIGGRKFILTEELMEETFRYVIKALKK
jgi:AcrR family transcriptional regulator